MSTSSPSHAVDASALSRRELQYLARELELCRGNAKSDVIVEHVVTFMAANDGAARVAALLNDMSEEYKLRTPGATTATPARRMREIPRQEVTPRAMDFAEDETPSRRSTRKSARTPTTQLNDSSESMLENPAKEDEVSTPPIGRKMDFDLDDSVVVESAEETETEKTATKKAKPALTKKIVAAVASPDAPVQTPTKKVVAAGGNTSATKESKASSSAKKATPEPKKTSAAGATPEAPALTPSKNTPTAAGKKSSAVKEPKLSDTARTPPSRRATPVKNGRSPLANVSNLAADAEKKSDSSRVDELIESTSDLVAVGSERVRCTTTGHEMKADYDVVTAYISGKRYERAHNQKRSFAKYAPMFVDHPDEKKPQLVWCSVTQTAIARDVERIEAHMNGARYQKELPVWQEEQAALDAAKKAEEEKQAAREKARAAKSGPTPTKNKKRKASGAIPGGEARRVKIAA